MCACVYVCVYQTVRVITRFNVQNLYYNAEGINTVLLANLYRENDATIGRATVDDKVASLSREKLKRSRTLCAT